MRTLHVVALVSSLAGWTLAAAPARADPEPVVGLVAGAGVMLLGFAVGGTVVATAEGSNMTTNAGWLIMQSGFALAPWTAHAALGQWARGLAFTALPAATVGGAAGLFDYAPDAVLHGSLVQQRVLWGLFGVGLVSSVLGVLDVTFANPHVGSIAIAPIVAARELGVQVGGNL